MASDQEGEGNFSFFQWIQRVNWEVFLLLHGLVRVPADEDHGEVHGAHGEHQVEEAEAVGDVVLLRLLRLLELRIRRSGSDLQFQVMFSPVKMR